MYSKVREIKFRAWDKNTNTMRYPDGKKCSESNGALIDWFEDEDLMQYTGLKDMNGREIYEGDIVGYYMFLPDETWDGATMVIEYDSENAQFKTPFSDTQNIPVKLATDSIEILGNVYENPALIPNLK